MHILADVAGLVAHTEADVMQVILYITTARNHIGISVQPLENMINRYESIFKCYISSELHSFSMFKTCNLLYLYWRYGEVVSRYLHLELCFTIGYYAMLEINVYSYLTHSWGRKDGFLLFPRIECNKRF